MAFPPASYAIYLTSLGFAPAACITIAATRWSIPPGTEPPPMATFEGLALYAETRPFMSFISDLVGTTNAA